MRFKAKWWLLEKRWLLPWVNVTWRDFPKGSSEFGEVKPCLLNLRYGKVFDAGIQHYGEFFVSLPYGRDLLRQGLFVNGVHGHVDVVARCTNAVQLKWWPPE